MLVKFDPRRLDDGDIEQLESIQVSAAAKETTRPLANWFFLFLLAAAILYPGSSHHGN